MTNPFEADPAGQPQGYNIYQHAPMNPPKNYLVWNILMTVACCMPLGVIGVIFSVKTDRDWSNGDYAAAERSSQRAKQIFIIGFIGGLVFGVGYAGLIYWEAMNQ